MVLEPQIFMFKSFNKLAFFDKWNKNQQILCATYYFQPSQFLPKLHEEENEPKVTSLITLFDTLKFKEKHPIFES